MFNFVQTFTILIQNWLNVNKIKILSDTFLDEATDKNENINEKIYIV